MVRDKEIFYFWILTRIFAVFRKLNLIHLSNDKVKISKHDSLTSSFINNSRRLLSAHFQFVTLYKSN